MLSVSAITGYVGLQPYYMATVAGVVCCYRSLESLNIAAEYDPSSVYTTFIRIKVLLVQGLARKALDLLQPLMACEDASPDFLRVRAAMQSNDARVNISPSCSTACRRGERTRHNE